MRSLDDSSSSIKITPINCNSAVLINNSSLSSTKLNTSGEKLTTIKSSVSPTKTNTSGKTSTKAPFLLSTKIKKRKVIPTITNPPLSPIKTNTSQKKSTITNPPLSPIKTNTSEEKSTIMNTPQSSTNNQPKPTTIKLQQTKTNNYKTKLTITKKRKISIASDASISFLENPFADKICTEINNKEITLQEYKNTNQCFFPKLLYDTFTYENFVKISGEHFIFQTTKNQIKYFVTNYPIVSYEKLTIVLGRKTWENKIKKEEKQSYLKSVNEGIPYTSPSLIESERNRLLNKQIVEHINFFYLDTQKDLELFMDSLFEDAKQFVKYKIFNKKALFNYLVNSVLGVNKVVAKAICQQFGSLIEFMEKGMHFDLTKIKYFIDGNEKTITKSIEKNVKNFFFFNSQSDFIYHFS
ncbi:hypothetical protein CDIK_1695 [Cucumispora dikerogammari]|nr:hypothetical protein CDIK_1695 [Cucumispora dikerogammari]